MLSQSPHSLQSRDAANTFVDGVPQIESDCTSTAAIGEPRTPIASSSTGSVSMPNVGEGAGDCGYGGRLSGSGGLCSGPP